ncbi:MAG: hypothetical protein D9V44_00995 [Actinobacteria bacterium]|nr:MAG: hypothetical protein D9V44_00995 [Actinomycetota bacterium]
MSAPNADADRRSVAALSVVLVLLLLVLAGVGYFFIRILVPAGSPAPSNADSDMTWVRSIYGYGPSAAEQLLGPSAVAAAPDGTIYATDPQRGRVLAFHPDGTFKGLIATEASGTATGGLGRPTDVAVDADGSVYVSDYANGKVLVFAEDFTFSREWKVPLAMGIDVVDSTVYVRSGGQVVTFATDGTELSRIVRPGRGPDAVTYLAGGITADARRVYVADALNQSIKAFDAGGNLLWARSRPSEVASGSVVGTSAATQSAAAQMDLRIDLPQDVVLDGAGRLIAVDAFSFSVLALDPESGEIEAAYGDEGRADGQFVYPSSIAYDARRDWFVIADTANNRLQVVRITGSGGGIGAAASRALASPFRVCAVPLLALVLAIGVVVATRGRRGSSASATGERDTSGTGPSIPGAEPPS